MSFVVKKRDLTDPAQLQALIVEHADDLERGLTILDSRLLLGQATIDLVAVDADGMLVLIALGLVADEAMFLKAVEAYSWCLEYPEAIRRLHPTVQVSSTQPPRVMFVVERMPDAFHRKIKQLGFPEVDCVEFRHLDVDGAAALYFDTLARLRRTAPAAPVADHGAAPAAPAVNGRPTSLKLQKLLGADRDRAAAREPAPVVRMVQRTSPRAEVKPPASPPHAERAVAPVPPVVKVLESPIAAPVAVAETTTAVAEADGMPEMLAQCLDASDAMVEAFTTVDRSAVNGHVEPTAVSIPEPEPLIRELEVAFQESAPVGAVVEATIEELISPAEPAICDPEQILRTELVVVDPEPAIRPTELAVATPEPAMRPTELAVSEPPPESRPTELAISGPEPENRPIELVSEPEPAIRPTELAVSEPEPAVQPIELAIAEPVEAALEIVRDVVAEELSPLTLESAPALEASAAETAEPVSTISVPEPELAVPVLELAPRSSVDTAPELAAPLMAAEPLVAEPEPLVTALTVEPVEPVAAVTPPPAPSVFSRRPAEAATARDTKVSFAGMAKDLMPQGRRVPEAEQPVSAPRASVEEITRGALDDLVGANDKRAADGATTVAKPGGPFAKAPTQKPPRTIAPPPSDGQPIGGGAKLGTAPKRVGPGENGAASPAEGEPTHTVQGFEGLQFPNDGVLTRQWMEFLNQMAAGK